MFGESNGAAGSRRALLVRGQDKRLVVVVETASESGPGNMVFIGRVS